MMRQSSIRIHRNRGWKVKHVLQICLLVTVCVWLLYQVKHSFERKRSSELGISRASERIEDSRPEPLKLGRKDPQLKTASVPTDGAAHSDDEESEEAEDAAEQQEDKQNEGEEEESANGEDDMDDIDRERSDGEADDGEGAGDGEEKESQPEDPNLPENDREEADEKSQVSREENYKADDVSSAVGRDTPEEARDHSHLSIVERPQSKEKDGLQEGSAADPTGTALEEHQLHESPTNASRKDTAVEERGFEIGPPPNSTIVNVSAGSVMDHNNTRASVSDLLEEHGSDSTRSEPSNHILPGNSASEPDNQTDFGNSTIPKPGNQTELGNSTISEPGNQIELGNSTISGPGDQIEVGNSSMSEPGNQIDLGNSTVSGLHNRNDLNFSTLALPSDQTDHVDSSVSEPGNQIEDTETHGVSTGNDTQSTDFPQETQSSANETLTPTAEESSSENVSPSVVEQNEVTRDNNDSDIIPPQNRVSNVTEGVAEEDHEALTDLSRVPEIHLGTENSEDQGTAAE
ncbi:unnamed protein product [Spirodela intermedia]|uniref:Uncharacterized protein n=1 Tax=Spirodela intermedia TaxID=51605 RepID=A0A7I8IIE3_SPIIN|nr:unnamed protein product [Spirodela intermedia]CAA6657643.1 unnamed protein product [Spirodela intermedia]